ncbi:MAG: YIP1 family protein [Planctomycetota bacterium]
MPIDLPCTGCRRQLSVRDEFSGQRIRCPACGAMVLAVAPAPPPSGLPLPGFAGPFFVPPEVLADKDQGRAWLAVLFSPSAFFAARGLRSTVGQAARVGLPFLLIGYAASSIQTWLLLGRIGPSIADWWKSAGLGAVPFDLMPSLPSVFRGQVLTEAVGLVVFPLALHLGVLLAGGRGVQKTCSIYFYSLTARILDVVPFGFLISMIYVLVLNYLGVRQVHRLSEGRSLIALLLALGLGVIGVFILFSCFALLQGFSLPDPR